MPIGKGSSPPSKRSKPAKAKPSGQVTLSGVSKVHCSTMLEWIYQGRAGFDAYPTAGHICGLRATAHRCGVEGLQSACDAAVASMMAPEHVVVVLLQQEAAVGDELRRFTLRFGALHLEEVVAECQRADPGNDSFGRLPDEVRSSIAGEVRRLVDAAFEAAAKSSWQTATVAPNQRCKSAAAALPGGFVTKGDLPMPRKLQMRLMMMQQQ